MNWMVGNSIPRSVQTGPRSPLARAGSRIFWGWLKIFWAVSIFFWAGSRDFFGLFNIFLALLKRYFVAGSIFFELAQYLFGLPQDTGCFFTGAP